VAIKEAQNVIQLNGLSRHLAQVPQKNRLVGSGFVKTVLNPRRDYASADFFLFPPAKSNLAQE
jgi:hypothetical protein